MFCGGKIEHAIQLKEEISIRRYQRWFFYFIISILFIVMTILIVKAYDTNTKILAQTVLIKKDLNETKDTLSKKEGELGEVSSDLLNSKEKMKELEQNLTEKSEELKLKTEELRKKAEEAIAALEEKEKAEGEKKTALEEYEKQIEETGLHIKSMIVKLGVGVSNVNLWKIPVAEVNFVGEDKDEDGLSDKLEDSLATDKEKADTDDDGHDDKSEILFGHNPNGEGVIEYDENFANNQKGKILLQVERNGEAWYVGEDGKRYFLGSPDEAIRVFDEI